MSEFYNSLGKNMNDLLTLGPAIDSKWNYTGWLGLQGALIHIDIDTGYESRATFRTKSKALDHVRSTFEQNAAYSGHVYETIGGVRVLMTHRLAFPKDAMEEMNAFRVDPFYRRGVLLLNKFITRVTPKPGRFEPAVATLRGTFGQGPKDALATQFVYIHDRLVEV